MVFICPSILALYQMQFHPKIFINHQRFYGWYAHFMPCTCSISEPIVHGALLRTSAVVVGMCFAVSKATERASRINATVSLQGWGMKVSTILVPVSRLSRTGAGRHPLALFLPMTGTLGDWAISHVVCVYNRGLLSDSMHVHAKLSRESVRLFKKIKTDHKNE